MAEQSSIDKQGNRYTLVSFDYHLILDSLGVPIVISYTSPSPANPNANNTALIKYDTNNVYQWHCTILSFSNSTDSISIPPGPLYNSHAMQFSCDSLNQLLFCLSAPVDSLFFSGPDGITHRFYNNSKGNNTLLLLGKLKADGRPLWFNQLERPTAYPQHASLYNRFTRIMRGLTTGSQLASIFALDVFSISGVTTDTLIFSHSNGSKDSIYIQNADQLIELNATGRLAKNVPITTPGILPPDAVTPLDAVRGDHGAYGVLLQINTPVTMNLTIGNTLQIDSGTNFLFTQFNQQLNTLSATFIGRGKIYSYSICHHKQLNEYLIGLGYYKDSFTFFPSALTSHHTGPIQTYIAGISSTGTIYTRQLIGGSNSDILVNIDYSSPRNEVVVLFRQFSDTTFIGTYPVIQNNTPYIHNVSFLNQQFNCIGNTYIPHLPNNTNQIGTNFRFPELLSPAGIGRPTINNKGIAYVSGSFRNAIRLSCNRTLLSPNINNFIDNGFVVKIHPPPLPKDTATCSALLSPSGKYIYTRNGIYYDTLTTNGCDSIIILNLTLLNTQSNIDSQTCSYSYISPSGRRIQHDSIFNDTIPNKNGCDSVIRIRISFLQNRSTIALTSCVPISSPSGKFTLDSSGTFIDTLVNRFGCDSLVTVNFSFNVSKSALDTFSCNPILTPSGKTWLTASGIYSDTLTNQLGCDSIITIRFTRPALNSNIEIVSCSSYTSPSRRSTFSQSGIYSDTIRSVSGCDSIITINLTIRKLNIQSSVTNRITCDTPHTQLSTTPSGYSYLWTPNSALLSPYHYTTIASPQSTQWYYVQITDSLGCQYSDSVLVNVARNDSLPKWPNIFTPNDDGVNDCLSIINIAPFDQINYIVYNRWGESVYETTNPGACWDGLDMQGNKVLPGTYYYTCKGKTKCQTFIKQQGTLTILY